jgi:hypothetical protein
MSGQNSPIAITNQAMNQRGNRKQRVPTRLVFRNTTAIADWGTIRFNACVRSARDQRTATFAFGSTYLPQLPCYVEHRRSPSWQEAVFCESELNGIGIEQVKLSGGSGRV